jgi:hypothetical protein
VPSTSALCGENFGICMKENGGLVLMVDKKPPQLVAGAV